jgi:L-lactate dehydrogenase (cytochrome)
MSGLSGTLEQYLPKDKHKGTVDMKGVKMEEAELSEADKERQGRLTNKPPLSECLSLHDFETVAKETVGCLRHDLLLQQLMLFP